MIIRYNVTFLPYFLDFYPFFPPHFLIFFISLSFLPSLLPFFTSFFPSIIVNSSRAILYASSGDDFAAAARREALKTRDVLQAARA